MSEPKIILKSTYKNYTYAIISNGIWYCAYVIIPEGHPLHGVHYNNIENIETHGGLTFSNYHKLLDCQWAIGWDYAHIGDYNPIFGDNRDEMVDGFGMPPHHWTPKEIEIECKDAIEQLINAEK